MKGVSYLPVGRKLILCQQDVNLLKTEDKSVTQLGKKEAGCILKKKNHR